MYYFTLIKWGQRIGFVLGIFCIFFIYYELGGKKITEKQALFLCSNIIYSNISKDFIVSKYIYNDFFNLSDSKIQILVNYGNGRKFSSDCIFKRRNRGDVIHIKTAYIIDPKATILIYDDIKVKYND